MLRSVDLFCGAGGTSSGAHATGGLAKLHFGEFACLNFKEESSSNH